MLLVEFCEIFNDEVFSDLMLLIMVPNRTPEFPTVARNNTVYMNTKMIAAVGIFLIYRPNKIIIIILATCS